MRLARLVTPEGMTMDDWRIAQELATALRRRLRATRPSRTCRTRSPASRPRSPGVDAELVRRARDGAVLPDRRLPRRDRASTPCRVSTRACRGSRSSPASPPTSRTSALDRRDGRGRRRRDQAGRQRRGPDGRAADDGRGSRRGSRPPRCTSGTARSRRRCPMPPDAYSLRLVAARTLYDAGRMVSASPSLAALATGAALVVHPSDLDRIGVSGRGRRRARHHAARHRSRCRCSPTPPPRRAPRSCRSRRAATSAPTTSSTSRRPVTELRVETTR